MSTVLTLTVMMINQMWTDQTLHGQPLDTLITVYWFWVWQIHLKAYHQEMLIEVLYLHFIPVLPLLRERKHLYCSFYIFYLRSFDIAVLFIKCL